jgi:hypothetical protein
MEGQREMLLPIAGKGAAKPRSPHSPQAGILAHAEKFDFTRPAEAPGQATSERLMVEAVTGGSHR